MKLLGSGPFSAPVSVCGQYKTKAENGPHQVQKWLPLTGPLLALQVKPFHLAMQKTTADRFSIPFSGSVSPNGAIFLYLLFFNPHRSFRAILEKRYNTYKNMVRALQTPFSHVAVSLKR